MTNPIAIAKPAQPTGQPAGRIKIESAPAPDFAGMIPSGDAAFSGPGRAIGAQQTTPVATETVATPAQSELATELSGLLEKLAALTEKLDENGSLDETDLEELENLLAGIETLLDQGAPLPLPDTPAFAAIADLAASLGLTPAVDAEGAATAPFDAMAGLATRLADGLHEQAPELAARLTDLARTLDTHSAAIHTALADEQAIAASSVKRIESETKPNPAATIAAQSAETADQQPVDAATKDTAPPPSDRSLVKDGQTAPAGADTRPANPQSGAAGGPAASTAPAPAELKAPDGLVISAPQAQTATSTSAAMRPEAALYQRPDAQINLPHIAAAISRQIQNGTSRFEIRLNPAELGRIDVRMDLDSSGNVVARLAVERSETLDLLQRDQRSLERALADAGLDASKTELEFSLQQQGQNAQDEAEKSPWRHSIVSNLDPEASITSTNADLNPSMRSYARLDAVNLWV